MSLDVEAPTGGRAGGPAGGPAQASPATRAARVVAVLVVHDGAQWLPRTLAALAGSDRRPDVVVAVDAGSTDRSAVLLDTAVGTSPARVVDAVVTGDRRDGFGTSVARGLAVADRLQHETSTTVPHTGLASGDEASGDEAAGPPGRHDPLEEWVWLLHDDSAPEPAALGELLSVVQASPTLAVAGCKQRGWDDPRTLVEVGATVSRGGRRLTDLGTGDIDQGQHDDRGDVLLVSTAGMLVRRSVLDHVGGFDPAIPLVGDDVDLCLRVRRAGHRVAVVPTAAVRHAAALERGARPADALHGRLARRVGAAPPRAGRGGGLEDARRRHWLHSRLVQAPAVLVPLLWLWVVLAAPARALVFALRGRPARAWAELAATVRLVARSWRVQASRWRSRRSRAVPSSALRTLQRSRTQVARADLDAWRARRSLRRAAAAGDGDEGAGVPLEAVESGPVDDETIDLDLGASGPARRFFGHPSTYLLPLLLLLGALPVVRAALRPPPVDVDGVPLAVDDPTAGLTAVELWARAVSGWRDVGTGTLGPADPATTVWAGLTAAVSLVTRGSVDSATLGDARTAVVLLGPVLAYLLAYPVARRLLRRRASAAGAATAWALLPLTGVLGEVHAGDLLGHALLPVLAAAAVGCLGARPLRSLGATGLLSGLVVALEPGAWPVLVLVAVLVGVVGGSRVLASWRACLPVVGVAAPALLWAGWVASLRADPRALLLDPSSTDPTAVPVPTAAGLVPAALRAGLVTGDSPATADPAALLALLALCLLGLGVLLAGLLVVLALVEARTPAAWCAVGVAAAAAATGVVAALAARSTATEPSVPASAAALGLALAAALALGDGRVAARGRGVRAVLARALGALGAVGRVLVPVTAVAVAVAVGLGVPAPDVPDGLPSPALVGSQSPQATRTLLLGSPDGQAAAADSTSDSTSGSNPDSAAGAGAGGVLVWSVTGGQPGPGQASTHTLLATPERPVRAGDRRLADVVASLLGDGSVPGSQVAGALAELGIGWVAVQGRPEVDTALARRAGLVRTARSEDRTTWRVDSVDAGSGTAPARARVQAADGSDLGLVDLRDGSGRVPAGEPGRVLVLAESARDSWTATLGGTSLSPTVVGGWAQGFLLPADGGEVVVGEPALPTVWRVVPVAALALLLLAVVWPGRRHRPRLDLQHRAVRDPAPSSRTGRAVRVGGRVLVAGAVTAAVVAMLVAATGVGRSPGALELDRALAGATAPLPAPASSLARPLDALLDRVPPPDPVAAAPVVRLASAGTVQTCPPAGALTEGVVPVEGSDAARAGVPDGAELRGLRVDVVREGDDRGLRLAACPRTATESWVLLGGTGVGEEPRLLLANPGETAAVVDVRLGGPEGPLVTPASTGVLVAPGEQAEVAVDALAPDQPAVLAHVVARVGTVAVTGSGSTLAGLVPQGGDTQAAQTSPATSLVLPWVRVPGERREARLLVGSVGTTPAVVRVRLVAAVDGAPAAPADGAVDGAPAAPVVAPAGGVVEVDLGAVAPGDYAVHLEADVPVVASWTRTEQRSGEPADGVTGVPVDRAWTQAVPAGRPWRSEVVLPLAGLGAVPGGRAGTVLGLAAAGTRAGSARVAALDHAGDELVARRVELAPDGAPVGLRLADLLAGLDPATVVSLSVTSPDGVHVGLQTALDDPEGSLVASATVPGPEPEATSVRLVRD